MNQHQTDSVHRAEQTPATQPADEAVTALTDEELEQASGGKLVPGRKLALFGVRDPLNNLHCELCGAEKKISPSTCPNPDCPTNQK